MNLKNKKIVVTGADGFIGSHLVETLVRQGCNTRAFVQYNSFNSFGWLDHSTKEIIKNTEVYSGDIRDLDSVSKGLSGCDVVFHLAALVAIPYSYTAIRSYVETNVIGTLNVMSAATSSGMERIVCTSTSETYGTAISVPITEEHPLQPQSPYSASKIGADMMALSFFHSFDSPVCILRPFNTYGPRQSARAVIPTIIAQAMSGADNIMLGDLEPTRDFSFIEDTVQGFIEISKVDSAIGTITNLGSGFEISIGETAKLIMDIIGSNAQITTDKTRLRPPNSEVERLFAGTDKLRSLTNWTPAYAGVEGFQKGLTKTIEWFTETNHKNLYKAHRYNL